MKNIFHIKSYKPWYVFALDRNPCWLLISIQKTPNNILFQCYGISYFLLNISLLLYKACFECSELGHQKKMNSGYVLHVFLCWSHLSQLAESSIVPEKREKLSHSQSNRKSNKHTKFRKIYQIVQYIYCFKAKLKLSLKYLISNSVWSNLHS